MQPSDFSKNKAGHLINAPQGYWAFNPAPLPPPLTLTWELAGEISAADRALSELAGVARTLPNPHLLISPFIRREAVLSSRIEGTQASLSDLFFYEASQTAERLTADVQEVANYVHALEYSCWMRPCTAFMRLENAQRQSFLRKPDANCIKYGGKNMARATAL